MQSRGRDEWMELQPGAYHCSTWRISSKGADEPQSVKGSAWSGYSNFCFLALFYLSFPQVARWKLRDWGWGCAGHEEIGAVTADWGRWMQYQSPQSRFFRKILLKKKKTRNTSRQGTGLETKDRVFAPLGPRGRGQRRMACQTFSADSFTPLALDSPLPILMHHVSTSDCLPTTSHAHSMVSPGNLSWFFF